MMLFKFSINLLEAGLIAYCLRNISKMNHKYKFVYLVIWWMIQVLILCLWDYGDFQSSILTIIGFVWCLVYLVHFTEEGIIGKFSKVIMIQLTILICNQISLLIIAFTRNIDIIKIDDSKFFIDAILLSKLFLWISYYLLCKLFNQIGDFLISKNWFSIIIGLFCVKYSLETNYHILLKENIQTIDVMSSSIGLIILIIVFFNILYDVEMQARKQMKKDLALKSYENSLSNYEYLMEKEEELHIIKHDLQKVLTFYKILLDDNKIEEVKQSLNQITNEINFTYLPVSIQNPILNMVINEKSILASQQNLKISYMIHCGKLENLKINDQDFYLLLCNILDNAIENCKDEGTITIKISEEYGGLDILIGDEVEESVSHKNPTLKTNKDTNNHGYGIRIMKKIIHKVNGKIEFYEEQGLFYCNVHLNT